MPGRGSVVGWRFVTHPLVRKICFTGSTDVGKRIMAGCADQLKRVTLELGGKSANVVFADSDLERAAATAPASVFDNAGQDCCSRSRLLVEASVHDRFLELLEPAVRNFRAIDPLDETSEMGPLISAEQRSAVAAYVPDDAPVAFAGTVPDGPGYWFPPTVLAPVAADSPAFGRRYSDRCWPSYRSRTRPTPSGSPTTRPTACPARSGPATSQKPSGSPAAIDTGTLSVNSHSSVRYWTPFGGFKQSGIGRELGPDALEAFTELKNVFVSTTD